MPRVNLVVRDHINGVLDRINNQVAFPVTLWERPEDGQERSENPPFGYIRVYPSAEQFDGPLTDTQQIVTMRFQTMGMGYTADQAIHITDLMDMALLDRRLITIPNRRVMSLRRMITAGGQTRGEDLPDPYHFNMEIYTIRTTPTNPAP